ncbi:Hypothetical protein A7982_08042 [Minicystis rosea]|nr:Hypothetical protein A7982_08042 [Minicystis rosea]
MHDAQPSLLSKEQASLLSKEGDRSVLHRHTRILFAGALVFLLPQTAYAGDFNADPTSYAATLATLMPGDTLHLAAGQYPPLVVSGLNGSAASPITIEGASGGGAVITGDPNNNTVEIINSSYVVIKALTVDSKGQDGVFGLSAKQGASNTVHHITVDGCHFIGQNASQGTVGISTKTPTWGWVIRGNVIDGAGTGMYLGNSDGSYPFVGGLIEGNLIQNTIGYNAQIKYQNPWPSGAGLPEGPNRTIIRNNVFIKNDQPSEDGDRPNLYIGGLPSSGSGSQDLYEIYGNFFYHNPRESLMQAEGRVTIHDNVFVDTKYAAITVQQNNLPVTLAHVYNNTIYAAATGIQISSAAPQGDFVVGNLVFAATPITGPITTNHDNIVDTVQNAALYVNMPSTTLGSMDFYPNGTKATGPAMDLSSVATETGHDIDFNGTSKGTFTYRGAYAGAGTNPGWPLGDGLKDGAPSTGVGGSSSSSSSSGSSGTTSSGAGNGGGGAGTGGDTMGDGGPQASSGCAAAGGSGGSTWALLVAIAAMVSRRRRARGE